MLSSHYGSSDPMMGAGSLRAIPDSVSNTSAIPVDDCDDWIANLMASDKLASEWEDINLPPLDSQEDSSERAMLALDVRENKAPTRQQLSIELPNECVEPRASHVPLGGLTDSVAECRSVSDHLLPFEPVTSNYSPDHPLTSTTMVFDRQRVYATAAYLDTSSVPQSPAPSPSLQHCHNTLLKSVTFASATSSQGSIVRIHGGGGGGGGGSSSGSMSPLSRPRLLHIPTQTFSPHTTPQGPLRASAQQLDEYASASERQPAPSTVHACNSTSASTVQDDRTPQYATDSVSVPPRTPQYATEPVSVPPHTPCSGKKARDGVSGGCSVHKGVRLRPWGKWAAEVRDATKKGRVWLGTFDSEAEAVFAYDIAMLAVRGPGVKLNDERHRMYAGSVAGLLESNNNLLDRKLQAKLAAVTTALFIQHRSSAAAASVISAHHVAQQSCSDGSSEMSRIPLPRTPGSAGSGCGCRHEAGRVLVGVKRSGATCGTSSGAGVGSTDGGSGSDTMREVKLQKHSSTGACAVSAGSQAVMPPVMPTGHPPQQWSFNPLHPTHPAMMHSYAYSWPQGPFMPHGVVLPASQPPPPGTPPCLPVAQPLLASTAGCAAATPAATLAGSPAGFSPSAPCAQPQRHIVSHSETPFQVHHGAWPMQTCGSGGQGNAGPTPIPTPVVQLTPHLFYPPFMPLYPPPTLGGIHMPKQA